LTDRDALLQGPVEREYTGTVTVVDPSTFDVKLDGVTGDD
jgi:diaminopimelate epimerase